MNTHGAGGKVAIAENAICICQSARKLFSRIHSSLELVLSTPLRCPRKCMLSWSILLLRWGDGIPESFNAFGKLKNFAFWSCSRLYCGFEKVCDLEDIRIEFDQSFGGPSWGSHVPQALLCCEASIVSLESDYLTSWNLRIFLSLHWNQMCVWIEPIQAGRESSTVYN